MSMHFNAFFKVISNDHGGYCSGEDCEEEEREDLRYRKIITLPVEFFKNINININEEVKDVEIFDLISRKCNYIEETDHGSGYCGNKSEDYEIHTINYIVEKIIFLGFTNI
jgi:hypothetical protein